MASSATSPSPFAPPLHARITAGLETQDDAAIARAIAASEEGSNADGFDLNAVIDGDEEAVGSDDWTVQTGRRVRKPRHGGGGDAGGDAAGSTSSVVGLGNRYGENNCYLNVVLQSLYRLLPFRRRFVSEFASVYSKVAGRPTLASLRQVKVAAALLTALHDVFTGMDATSKWLERASGSSTSSTGVAVAGDAAVSLSPLKKALHAALLEREILKDTVERGRGVPPKAATPKSSKPSVGTSSITASAALMATIASRAMGDASEAMEEIVTLLHESEAVVAAVAGLGAEPKASAALAALEAVNALASTASATSGEVVGGGGVSGGVSTITPTTTIGGGVGVGYSKRLELGASPLTCTSVALSTFGQLIYGLSVCPNPSCGSVTAPTTYTALSQPVNTLELLHARARLLSDSPTRPPSFGSILRAVIEDGDARSCRVCGRGGPLRAHRALVRPSTIFTVSLGWLSSREPTDTRRAVLDSIDGYIDLWEALHQEGPAGVAACALAGVTHGSVRGPLPARLRGLVCYVDNHWVAFFDESKDSKASAWLCCNDEKVFPSEFPLAQAAAHGLQPALLFYETGQVGDRMPGDRGRVALHGDGSPVAPIPLSVALHVGAAKLAFESEEAFPSLPPTAPRPKRVLPPYVTSPPPAGAVAGEADAGTPPAGTADSPATGSTGALADTATAVTCANATTPVQRTAATALSSLPTTTIPSTSGARATGSPLVANKTPVPTALRTATSASAMVAAALSASPSTTTKPPTTTSTGANKPAPTTSAAASVTAAGRLPHAGPGAGGDRRRDARAPPPPKTKAEPVVDEDGFQLVEAKPPRKAAESGGGGAHSRGGGGGRGGGGRGRGR